MNETYVEYLVKGKASMGAKILKVVLILVSAACGVGVILFGGDISIFLLAIAAGVGAYFTNWYCSVEYEYLYLDKELVVDKILAQTRRKTVATYSLDRMEIMAPIKSYHLDAYKNRKVKVIDYSIGEERQPDLRYAIYYEGGSKIIISPSEEMVKVLKDVAPRKVFMD